MPEAETLRWGTPTGDEWSRGERRKEKRRTVLVRQEKGCPDGEKQGAFITAHERKRARTKKP